jgi:hypothetical protein
MTVPAPRTPGPRTPGKKAGVQQQLPLPFAGEEQGVRGRSDEKTNLLLAGCKRPLTTVLAGILTWAFVWSWADPVVSVVIAALVV